MLSAILSHLSINPTSSLNLALVLLILSLAKLRSRRKAVTQYTSDLARVQDGEYDFIIVGRGTPGMLLAARLSENRGIRVLLVEAEQGALKHKSPAIIKRLINVTESSSYPKYASINLHAVLDYLKKWAPVSKNDTSSWTTFTRQYIAAQDDAIYSQVEPLTYDIRRDAWKILITVHLTSALHSLINFWTKESKKSGTFSRINLLTPSVLKRKNLVIAKDILAKRILLVKKDGDLRACGIEFSSTLGGPVYRARSHKDIIMTGGTLHSPQLLLQHPHGVTLCSQGLAETGAIRQEHNVEQDVKIESSGSQEDGRVDSAFRLYGVKGLRVCDASVLPWLAMGPMSEGISVIAAEKLADLLKGEYDAM